MIFGSSYTTATLFKQADMNPPIEALDKIIRYTKFPIISCDGTITFNSTSGVLSWTDPLKILGVDSSGGIFTNVIASGSLTLSTGSIAYADLSTVNNATVSATFVALAAASTVLVPSSRIVLGMVNTTKKEFYSGLLFPSFQQMVSTASVHAQQHNIDSSADHASTATEGNILIASSAGLAVDGGIGLSAVTAAISSLETDVAAISTHAQQHNIDSSADHGGGTATEGNILIASSAGLPIDAGKKPADYLGGRESSITCSASTFTVDFSTAETRFLELTTNSSCIITGGVNGQVYRLRVTQGATGGWTLAFGATAGSISWRGGIAPSITTVAAKSDWLTFVRSNDTWFADAAQNF